MQIFGASIKKSLARRHTLESVDNGSIFGVPGNSIFMFYFDICLKITPNPLKKTELWMSHINLKNSMHSPNLLRLMKKELNPKEHFYCTHLAQF